MDNFLDKSVYRRLSFRHLEIISEVAEKSSLGQAADKLNLSRAAVSKSLKEVESIIGIVLFERSAKGTIPTAAGLRISRHARFMLNELRHVLQFAHGDSPAVASLLRIGMPAYLASDVAPRLLSRLSQEATGKEIHIQIYEGQLNSLLDRLLSGELDAALTLFASNAVASRNLNMFFLREVEPIKMVAVASPLAKFTIGDGLSWESLVNIPWILPLAGTHLRKTFDEMFTLHAGKTVTPAIESLSLNANLNFAISGLGVAIVPESFASTAIKADLLKILPIEPALPEAKIVLIFKRVSAIYSEAIQLLDLAASRISF